MTYTITISLPFSILTILLGVVALLNLLLALRVWRSNPKYAVNIYYALSTAMIGVWTISLLGLRVLQNPTFLSFAGRTVYASIALAVLFFYLFSYYFPYNLRKRKPLYFFMIIVSTIIMIVISSFPDVLIAGQVPSEHRFNIEAGYGWQVVFTIYFITVGVITFWNLWMKFKQTDGIWRRRVRQVMIGLSVPFVCGVVLNLLVPLYIKGTSGSFGPLFTLFSVSYIWYNVFWKTGRVQRPRQ